MRYMKIRQIKTKSDTVRTAIAQPSRIAKKSPSIFLRDLFGAGRRLPLRPRKYWLKENDLWRKGPLLALARKK
jgi:hypothetical protein